MRPVQTQASMTQTGKIDFLLGPLWTLLLSAILKWCNNTRAHDQNNELKRSETGLKSVHVYMVLWSDFRPVLVICVASATRMSEM